MWAITAVVRLPVTDVPRPEKSVRAHVRPFGLINLRSNVAVPKRTLSVDDVYRHVEERSFAPSHAQRVGVEAEWLTIPLDEPSADLHLEVVEEVVATAAPLPGGSLVTFEPGGQLELSCPPHDGVSSACMALLADSMLLGNRLLDRGISLVGFGMDPVRRRPRLVRSPRYDAMEAYFDAQGPAGRTMMCDTAGLQVNLDLGPPEGMADRWSLVHALAPTLGAIFANSPLVGGMPSGWRSTRLATWCSIDRTRTAPPGDGPPPAAWARYALDANVMMIRASGDRCVPMAPGFSFASWMADGHELGFPTDDDLAHHLTTLFPPVRPRGWMELRMIDALPEPWWRVAVAVTTALVYDAEASARAAVATAGTGSLWQEAARHGLRHPALERSAQHCFAAALEALPRVGTDATTFAAAVQFYERYVSRSRCPADDPLDAWARDPDLPLSQSVMDAWT